HRQLGAGRGELRARKSVTKRLKKSFRVIIRTGDGGDRLFFQRRQPSSCPGEKNLSGCFAGTGKSFICRNINSCLNTNILIFLNLMLTGN
ncbi:MAG: hypothetical protein ACM3NF_01220, partial [Gemmatimonadota bacterium]